MGTSKRLSPPKTAKKNADGSPSKPSPRGAENPLEYYLGCFIFDEFSDRDGEGSFQVIVQARSPEDAVERFRKLLEKLRLQTTLFHRPCSIFLEGLLRLRGSFEEGLLVNYTSMVPEIPPEAHASIYCLVPEQDHASESYGWSPEPKGKKRKKQEEEEEGIMVPFIDFGGQSLREERAAKQRAQIPPSPPPANPAAMREEAAKKKADADLASKKAAEARQKALANTMRELQATERPRSRS